MDPRYLRTFVAVARLGSFSAAAAELGYTQSAVSQHIAALEADLGAPLLHRRPVRPTAAGERLLEHAHAILLRLDAARAEVARTREDLPQRLVVGATPLAAMPLLARALERVRRPLPRLEVAVQVSDRAAVATAVATGELDLALADGVAAPSDPLRQPDGIRLEAVAVAEDPLVVVLPADHPLAGRDALALDAFADARWIDAPEVAGPLGEVRAAAGIDGFRPALAYAGTDVAGVLALVAAGHGLTLAPARALAGRQRLAGVRIDRPRLVHRTELLRTSGPWQGPASALAGALAA